MNRAYDLIIEIATAYSTLSEERSSTGFLTRVPTTDELSRLEAEGGLHISQKDNQVVGYLTTHHALSEHPEMVATRAKFEKIHWYSDLPPLSQLMYCDQMAIRPGWQRQGIANEILQSLMDRYPSFSLLAAIVEAPVCNTASKEFCLKHGFVKIGERVLPEYRGLKGFRSGWYLFNVRASSL